MTLDGTSNQSSHTNGHHSQHAEPYELKSGQQSPLPDGVDGLHEGRDSHFVLEDKPIDEVRPFKVVVIGAGFSGINCAIRSVSSFADWYRRH